MMVMEMFKDLFSRLQFWNAKNFVVLDKHYEFMLDISNKEAMTIRILKKYPGVIIEYTNIHMSTENQMSYDIDVIANPNLCKTDDKKFEGFTTAIFRSILLGSIELAKEKHENGNTDTFEFDSERGIHEKVAPVPEKRISNRKPRKKTVRRNKAVHSEVQQPSTDSSVKDQFEGVDQTN